MTGDTTHGATVTAPSVRAPGGRRTRRSVTSGSSASRRPAAGTSATCPGLLVEDWADPRWTQRLASSTLLLFDRASGEESAKAREQAVQGLHDGMQVCAEKYGIDARPAVEWLGGRAELLWRLEFESQPHVSDNLAVDGKPIVTNLLIIKDLLPHGVLIVLQTGSGTKIDTAYHQPAAFLLASQVIRPYQPQVLFSREWPRAGRDGFAMGPVVYELRQIEEATGRPAVIGAQDIQMQELTDETEDLLFRQGQAARREAGWIGQRTGQARQKTATTVHHGRVPYAGTSPAPPGMARADVMPGAFQDGGPEDWPDTSLRRRQAKYLYIDTPACRPDPALVRTARAPLVGANGEPARDQAASVCWFLDVYGTVDDDGREWDRVRTARRMTELAYGNDALRDKRGRLHAVYELDHTNPDTLTHTAATLCRSITRHLDRYEIGAFRFAMPGHRKERVTIPGLFPPRGYWVTPERAAQIRVYEKNHRPVPARGALLFAGHPITLNGDPAWLEATVRGGPARYPVVREDGHRAGSRLAPIPPITHDFLVAMVAHMFDDDLPLPRLQLPENPVQDLEAAVAAADAAVAAKWALQEHRMVLLEQKDPALPPATLARIGQRHADGEDELATLETAAAAARVALDAARAPNPVGIPDDRLLPLLAALADPRSPLARQLLRRGLEIVVLHDVITEPGHVPRHRMRVRMTMTVHNGRDSWVRHREEEFEGGPAAKVPPRLAAAVDALRAGTPLWDSLGADWRRWKPLVLESLGPAGRATRALAVDDPRLLRLVMAVVHPTPPGLGPDPNHPRLGGPATGPAQLPALAATLGEPPALLARILEVHTGRRPAKWLHQESTVIGAAYAAAVTGALDRAAADATVRRQLRTGPFGAEWCRNGATFALAPCASCHGTDRVPLRLREATGSVCARCRTDRAGVPWPIEYDRYAHPRGASLPPH